LPHPKNRFMQEKILILDFGSQYTQLIGRRVRELNIYCEIYPYNHYPEIDETVKGVILSGSPFSVRDENGPKPDLSKIKGKLPLLGVCYGAQYMAHYFGGEVLPSDSREYGRANLGFIDQESELFKEMTLGTQVWMSHGDTIERLPENYKIIASTADVKNAAYKIEGHLRHPVSPRGLPYHRRQAIATEFCGRHLWLQTRLDAYFVYRNHRGRAKGKAWQ